MKFSSVVSLHTNPFTCGVAKFGAEMAKRLEIPFIGINGPWGHHPLFSLKWSEPNQLQQMQLIREIGIHGHCSVFWHDAGCPSITKAAKHVFYADPSLGSPGLWCPSLITPKKRPVRLFSFGMAHKLQTEHYRKVVKLLQAAQQPYHLRVSVGLHEGTSLDGAEKHFDALRDIMGEQHVTILGILSDDAVSEELANADYVLAFFEKGLRANNTTVHAALDARCPVVTNLDDLSPAEMGGEVNDIGRLIAWPAARWTPVGNAFSPNYYSWDALIEEMKGVCDQSKLPTAS
jgi:hypothetical protein